MKKVYFLVFFITVFCSVTPVFADGYADFFAGVARLQRAHQPKLALESLDRQLWASKNPIAIVGRIYLTKAIIRMGMDEYQTAVMDLNTAEENYESVKKLTRSDILNKASIPYRRGYCFFILGEYENAINDFSSAISLRYNAQMAYYYRGEINYKLKNLQLAIHDLKNAGRSWQAYNLLGWIFATTQSQYYNPKLAVKYAKAALLFDVNAYTVDTLATSFAAVKNFKLAVALEKDAILMDKTILEFKERLNSFKNKKPWKEGE